MLRSSAETLAQRFFKSLGYWPDLENPRTLQEKIYWRRLREDMTEAVLLADKAAVRDHVRDVVGEKYLTEVYAIVDNANDIDFGALPESFVLKVNRSSGTNMVVLDKAKLDVPAIQRLLNSLLKLEYGRRLGEHWYASMPPKLLVERLLVDRESTIPVDYRFHCFHGKVAFIQVTTGKRFADDLIPGVGSFGQTYVDNQDRTISNYDAHWQPAPFHFRTSEPSPPLAKTPGGAAEMLTIAEKLAGDWGYLRVDLYCLNDSEVYFSELTFAHNAGLFGFIPGAYNEYFGSLWDITRRYVRSEPIVLPVLS